MSQDTDLQYVKSIMKRRLKVHRFAASPFTASDDQVELVEDARLDSRGFEQAKRASGLTDIKLGPAHLGGGQRTNEATNFVNKALDILVDEGSVRGKELTVIRAGWPRLISEFEKLGRAAAEAEEEEKRLAEEAKKRREFERLQKMVEQKQRQADQEARKISASRRLGMEDVLKEFAARLGKYKYKESIDRFESPYKTVLLPLADKISNKLKGYIKLKEKYERVETKFPEWYDSLKRRNPDLWEYESLLDTFEKKLDEISRWVQDELGAEEAAKIRKRQAKLEEAEAQRMKAEKTWRERRAKKLIEPLKKARKKRDKDRLRIESDDPPAFWKNIISGWKKEAVSVEKQINSGRLDPEAVDVYQRFMSDILPSTSLDEYEIEMSDKIARVKEEQRLKSIEKRKEQELKLEIASVERSQKIMRDQRNSIRKLVRARKRSLTDTDIKQWEKEAKRIQVIIDKGKADPKVIKIYEKYASDILPPGTATEYLEKIKE